MRRSGCEAMCQLTSPRCASAISSPGASDATLACSSTPTLTSGETPDGGDGLGVDGVGLVGTHLCVVIVMVRVPEQMLRSGRVSTEGGWRYGDSEI